MNRQSPLVLIGIAILIMIAANLLLSSLPQIAIASWLSQLLVLGTVVYVVGAILVANAGRFRLPAVRRRRRMRVVPPRDPSRAAADFIKQFEDRANR